MKRKIEDSNGSEAPEISTAKRRANGESIIDSFRQGFFGQEVLEGYREEYAQSEPYKHGVIRNLISDALLRSVRSEIQENLQFSPKETDIYKIHQTGDLANLDGLDDSSLKLLPSLKKLRDALYSEKFRTGLSKITGSGPLSGKRTDMAINVYTPGCYLLCHDDVIGSRRVSYILYLTDPDTPWKASWGGALRLYDTVDLLDEEGEIASVPEPEPCLSITPSFNQLAFFAVQPGKSFHDVEEVYSPEPGSGEEDGGRVRMAISGWFHIPQEGEDGYIPGLEEELAEKSSLVQLQGKADHFDLPRSIVHSTPIGHENGNGTTNGHSNGAFNGKEKESEEEDDDPDLLTESDINRLLPYLSPTYLTPATLSEISLHFEEKSQITFSSFLRPSFAERLKSYITSLESTPLPPTTSEIESTTDWIVARPPHKHRFLFQQPRTTTANAASNPLRELYETLLPSRPFLKWLSLATSLSLSPPQILARRFRRGKDYTLATPYNPPETSLGRLEITLGITPTSGWDAEGADHGGYEVYFAEDEDGEDGKVDPAVYRQPKEGEEGEEEVLASNAAGWGGLSVVLRDGGVLRFVKFVGKGAPGDRWDVVGEWGVEGVIEGEEGSEVGFDGEGEEVGDDDEDGEEGEEGAGDGEEDDEEDDGAEEDDEGEEEDDDHEAN